MSEKSAIRQTDSEGALQAIAALPAAARVLLLGAPDTGKTTFARDAINQLAGPSAAGREPRPVALIDSDIGQTEIGPPGVIGLAAVAPGLASLPLAHLHGLPLAAAAFVGATSPPGHLPELLAGVVRMVDAARRLAPHCLALIDTPGYVVGPAARSLIRSLADAVQPAMILGFARNDELGRTLALFAHRAPPPVVARVQVGPQVGRKSPAVRAARRAARFNRWLDGAAELVFAWESVDLLNAPLGMGQALAAHHLKFIANSVGSPCLYAEQDDTGALFGVLAGAPRGAKSLAPIEEQFCTRRITLVPEEHLTGLLCGLLDRHGAFAAIGMLQSVDFSLRTLTVLTPLRRPEAAAQIVFGSVRLRADGREIGALRL